MCLSLAMSSSVRFPWTSISRAGATVNRDHDDADLGQRRIECPLLALWSAGGALPRFYGDVLDVWRP
jgi:haloacetate dehalogenase